MAPALPPPQPAPAPAGVGLHYLKCWPSHYQRVLDGKKPYEIRLDDRDYAEGDVLVLSEWDPARGQHRVADGYTGRSVRATVTCITRSGDLRGALDGALGDDYVVLGIAVDASSASVISLDREAAAEVTSTPGADPAPPGREGPPPDDDMPF